MTTPTFPQVQLSVVLPAYNEEQNLERTLERATRSLERHVGAFELIVIDDASRDGTRAVAERFARVRPEVRVIANEANLRQGGCLAKGFRLARLDWVTHNAADYPFDFEHLPDLLRHLPGADVVVASRRTYPGTSVARRGVSLVNRLLIRALFAAPFHDYNFIQIYRRSLLDQLPELSTATSFITPEKIIRAHVAGRRVVEVEVDYQRRLAGKPSSANARNIRQALRDMTRLRVELWRGR